MLLFIDEHGEESACISVISIHLMLLFISPFMYRPAWFLCISIHLMLLFILFWWVLMQQLSYFNTSHVTVYPHPVLLPVRLQ